MTVLSPGLVDSELPGGRERAERPLRPRPRHRRRARSAAFGPPAAAGSATLAYLALALLAYWPVQPFSSTKVVTCGCYDVAEQMWFLAWTPHALAHLLNPFFTSALDVPAGANLAANTTMPLLGLIASPITATLGPVAAYNALIRLALFSSALSMCLVLRHYRLRWPVAFLGGLVYGFSPYELSQGSLHLNLCFVGLLPLLVVAIDELVVTPAHSTRRAGLTLGGLASAQYFVSSELLADLGVLVLVALVLLAARHPRLAAARLRRIAGGLAWSLAPFVLLAGYPIAFGILGPQHYVKTWQVTNGNEQIRNDLLSPIVPTTWQLVAPASWSALGSGLVGGVAENGGYLGIPLACCWLATLVWSALRRRGRCLLFAVMAGIAFLLSLGPSLQVHGIDRGIALPFGLSARLPLLDVAVAARYSLFVAMAVVLSVAAGLDALWSTVEHGTGRLREVRLAPAAGVSLLVVAALLPLLPAHSEGSAPIAVPPYFTSSAADAIPSGSNVLVYPYPLEHQDFSMLWQAETGFRFDLLGGYVLTPLQTEPPPGAGPGGGDTPPTLDPPIVQILFYSANANAHFTAIPPLPWATRQVEAFIHNYAVSTVVLDTARTPAPAAADSPLGVSGDVNLDPGAVVSVFRALFGPPVREGALDIWYRADVRTPRRGFG